MLPTVRAFVRLSRLKFLAGGFVGGALGTAMAVTYGRHFEFGAYVVAQATITSFHLMTHYANDFFDRDADARSARTPYSGGSGALVDGTLAPPVALVAARACAALGALGIGLLLGVAHAPLAALLALAMGIGAWWYSAPPLRLLARGLGELDTAIVVAVLVPLCAYAAQGATLDARALASTLPGAAAIFAMMLAVEFPDLASDAAGGKRNLVVRFGPAVASRIGIAATIGIYAFAALAVGLGAPPLFAIFVFATLPLGIAYVREILSANGTPTVASIETLAAKGVALFFIVTFYELLAY